VSAPASPFAYAVGTLANIVASAHSYVPQALNRAFPALERAVVHIAETYDWREGPLF
jgi:hypothetical protein